MGRSRYKIYEPTHPHFLTCTILNWLPIFTRKESVDITKSMRYFKSYTAKEILKLLQKENVTTILEQLVFYKKAHKTTSTYQIWQEGIQPKLMQTDTMMINKIKYIHENPVKRGYVDEAVHWRYSSARDYDGIEGLIKIERFW